MKIREIQEMPTCVLMPNGYNATHESTLKAYQILQKVKYYLEEKVPVQIVLELIKEMEESKNEHSN